MGIIINGTRVDSPPAWDDLRFPATRIRRGVTQKPDFDTNEIGLLFPRNDDNEIAYMIAQFPHA